MKYQAWKRMRDERQLVNLCRDGSCLSSRSAIQYTHSTLHRTFCDPQDLVSSICMQIQITMCIKHKLVLQTVLRVALSIFVALVTRTALHLNNTILSSRHYILLINVSLSLHQGHIETLNSSSLKSQAFESRALKYRLSTSSLQSQVFNILYASV